jgi:hypothetical protein
LKKRIAAVVALVYLGSGGASGANEAGFYAGADIGLIAAIVGKSDGVIVMGPNFPGPVRVLPETTRAEGSETSWNAFLGYRLNRYLAGELAYTDYGPVDIIETYDLGSAFPIPVEPTWALNYTASHLQGPSISIVGLLPVGERFEVFARAGVLFGAQELNLTSGPGVFRGPRLKNSVQPWLFGVGCNIALAEAWSFRFEFQSLERLPSNTITGPIRLERFALGVSYEF